MTFHVEILQNLLGRSCIVLSPEINPQVRDEAMKLASDWKSKIIAATEYHFEAFGLLYFIASYRFGSTVDENELHSLLDAVGLKRQALQLSPAICTVDKSTGKLSCLSLAI